MNKLLDYLTFEVTIELFMQLFSIGQIEEIKVDYFFFSAKMKRIQLHENLWSCFEILHVIGCFVEFPFWHSTLRGKKLVPCTKLSKSLYSLLSLPLFHIPTFKHFIHLFFLPVYLFYLLIQLTYLFYSS